MRKLTLVTAAMPRRVPFVWRRGFRHRGTQGLDVTITSNKAGTKDKPKSVGTLKVMTTTARGRQPGRDVRHEAGRHLLRQEPHLQCEASSSARPATRRRRSARGQDHVRERQDRRRQRQRSTRSAAEALTVKAYNGALESNRPS